MSQGTGRFVAWAYALGVYLVLLGCGLAALSLARESLVGKEYLHGVLAGFQLVFLAAPFLLLAQFPPRFAVGAMVLSAALWLVALGTLLVLLFPLEAVAALLRNVSEPERPMVLVAAGVVLQIGLHILAAGGVSAFLDLPVATSALRGRDSDDISRPARSLASLEPARSLSL